MPGCPIWGARHLMVPLLPPVHVAKKRLYYTVQKYQFKDKWGDFKVWVYIIFEKDRQMEKHTDIVRFRQFLMEGKDSSRVDDLSSTMYNVGSNIFPIILHDVSDQDFSCPQIATGDAYGFQLYLRLMGYSARVLKSKNAVNDHYGYCESLSSLVLI